MRNFVNKMSIGEITMVYTESTPNPESMKFVVNRMVLPNDSIDFRKKELVKDSPLAEALFDYDFVDGVFVMNNFITITKKRDYQWFDIIPQLKKFIKEYVEAEKPIKVDNQNLTEEEETEVVSKIKKLLHDHVRPAVEMDGGAIDFKSFENGIVTVLMKGACSGCPSSTMTLKAGIENLLKRMVPEVEAVESEAV